LSEGCNPSSGKGVWGATNFCGCRVCLSVCPRVVTRVLVWGCGGAENLSVGVCVCLSRGDYYFTNKLYPLCIAVILESIFILDKCGFYRGQYSSTYVYSST